MSPEDPKIASAMDDQSKAKEASVLSRVVLAFNELAPEAQQRVLNAVSAFLGFATGSHANRHAASAPPENHQSGQTRFSEDRTPSPKDFLFDKRPTTDVERIACLAYYLTHYMSTPYFKTLDLSKLNTDAAQLKFSNPSVALENATKAGFIVQASKGSKQLSALGELYVQALPDRESARAAIAHARPKRKGRRTPKNSAVGEPVNDNE